tara:strand:+ start:491 stop:733 length:243 start_codon:yes stop_codon:yes gene_type:complete
MWEKKEDPLWENYEIAVWASTIITVLFFWVSWFVNQGFDWGGVGMLSIISLVFGPIIFKIYLFLFGVVALLIEWFKKKSH